jgi:hypothetical protein
MKYLYIFSFYSVSLLFLSCDNNISPINNLKIYSNNVLVSENVYTDEFRLLKQIKYEIDGSILESTSYVYDNDNLFQALVSNHNTEIALVTYDFSRKDTIVLLVEPQNGYNGGLIDYPYSDSFQSTDIHGSIDGITEFKFAYSVQNEQVVIKLVGSRIRTAFAYNLTQTNIEYFYQYYGIQSSYTDYYNNDHNENIFNKFGFIKFNPYWLSFNNIIEIEFCAYDYYSMDGFCKVVSSYSYVFNEEGSPIEMTNDGVLYRFEYSKE